MKLSYDQMNKLGFLLETERSKQKLTLEEIKNKLYNLGVLVEIKDIENLEKAKITNVGPLLLNGLCKIYNLNLLDVLENIGFLNNPKDNTINNKIKIYNSLPLAIEFPAHFIDEIDLKLNSHDEIFGLKHKSNNSIIFIKKTNDITSGQKGAFKYKDEYYLRNKLEVSSGQVLLLEDDPNDDPVFITDKTDMKTLGKVIGILNIIDK